MIPTNLQQLRTQAQAEVKAGKAQSDSLAFQSLVKEVGNILQPELKGDAYEIAGYYAGFANQDVQSGLIKDLKGVQYGREDFANLFGDYTKFTDYLLSGNKLENVSLPQMGLSPARQILAPAGTTRTQNPYGTVLTRDNQAPLSAEQFGAYQDTTAKANQSPNQPVQVFRDNANNFFSVDAQGNKTHMDLDQFKAL